MLKIFYSLRKNPFTDNDDYYAQVYTKGPLDEDALRERMLAEAGGTTLTYEAIIAACQLREDTIIAALLEGYTVNTNTARYRLSIKGVFAAITDYFDPRRHRAQIKITAGKRLKKAVKQARMQKVAARDQEPRPLDYYDHGSETRNISITPFSGATLHGFRLKVDLAQPDEGIFFVAADRSATRVTQVMDNSPRRLIFMVPELAPGDYTLQIRARFGADLRTGVLFDTLTVAG